MPGRKPKKPIDFDFMTAANALAVVVKSFRIVRKTLAEHSIVFYSWWYMDIKLFSQQMRWLMLMSLSNYCLILSPRNHGKTTAVSIYICWMICKNRNIRILYLSGKESQAVKTLKYVRSYLEHNKKLINDFGTFYHHKNTWQATKITVIRSENMKDSTLEAWGIWAEYTGSRFDLIIFDDIASDKSMKEPAQRLKLKERIKGEVLPLLDKDGSAAGIGTRKHFDDPYADLLEQKLIWRSIVQRAIIRYPEKYEMVELDKPKIIETPGGPKEQFYEVVISGDPGKCLCPEQMSMEKLLVFRSVMGQKLFNREYQNIIVDDETTDFKLVWLQACCDRNLSYIEGDIRDEERDTFKIFLHGCDPSLVTDKKTADQKRSAYMVAVGAGLQEDGTRVIRSFYRKRGNSPLEVEKAIEHECRRMRSDYFFLEINAFATIHYHNIIKKTDIPIKKHLTTGEKSDPYTGVPMLAVMFENRKYRFPYKTLKDKEITNTIINELHSFGSAKFTDIVMAMWILETGFNLFQVKDQRQQDYREQIGDI